MKWKKWSRTPSVRRKAERVAGVQTGKEEALRRPYRCLPEAKGVDSKAGEGLFITACTDRTKPNDFKLEVGRFRLHIRKMFFTLRVLRHWYRLPHPWICSRSGCMGL